MTIRIIRKGDVVLEEPVLLGKRPPGRPKRKHAMPVGSVALPTGMTWDRLRIEFLTENLSGDRLRAYTLRELCEKYSLNYGSLRNVASSEKWGAQLTEMVKSKRDKSTEVVQAVQMVNEVEVRVRQAQFARLTMNKAILRIQAIDPAKLSVKEAVELLRLGMQEERKALGLVDTVVYIKPPETDTGSHGAEDAVRVAMAIISSLASPGEPRDIGEIIDSDNN